MGRPTLSGFCRSCTADGVRVLTVEGNENVLASQYYY